MPILQFVSYSFNQGQIELQDPYCVFVNLTKDSDTVFYAQAFNLFGFFWGISFAEALCQLTLAGAFASWYWAFRKPKDVPALPVLSSFYRALRLVMIIV